MIWKFRERDEIIQWIKEEIPSNEIRRRLLEKGVKVNQDTIRRFARLLTGPNMKSYVTERFKEIDKVINVTDEHARLIAMQKERIDRIYEKERLSEEDSMELRRNIELYNYLLKSHIELKQTLGLVPYPIKKSISMETAHMADLQGEYDKILKKKAVAKEVER